MTKVYLVYDNWEDLNGLTQKHVWYVFTNKKKALEKVKHLNNYYKDLVGQPRWFSMETEEITK